MLTHPQNLAGAGVELVREITQLLRVGTAVATARLAADAPEHMAILRPEGITVLVSRDLEATRAALDEASGALAALVQTTQTMQKRMGSIADEILDQVADVPEHLSYEVGQSLNPPRVKCCELEAYWHEIREQQLLMMEATARFSQQIEVLKKSLACSFICRPHPCTPGYRDWDYSNYNLVRRQGSQAETAAEPGPEREDDTTSAAKNKPSKRANPETGG